MKAARRIIPRVSTLIDEVKRLTRFFVSLGLFAIPTILSFLIVPAFSYQYGQSGLTLISYAIIFSLAIRLLSYNFIQPTLMRFSNYAASNNLLVEYKYIKDYLLLTPTLIIIVLSFTLFIASQIINSNQLLTFSSALTYSSATGISFSQAEILNSLGRKNKSIAINATTPISIIALCMLLGSYLTPEGNLLLSTLSISAIHVILVLKSSRKRSAQLDRARIRSLWGMLKAFMVPLALVAVPTTFSKQIDRWFVNLVYGETEFVKYVIALTLTSNLLAALSALLSRYYTHDIYRHLVDNEKTNILKSYRIAMKPIAITFIFGLGISLVFSLIGDWILAIYTNNMVLDYGLELLIISLAVTFQTCADGTIIFHQISESLRSAIYLRSINAVFLAVTFIVAPIFYELITVFIFYLIFQIIYSSISFYIIFRSLVAYGNQS